MNWRATYAIARKDMTEAVRNLYILFGLLLPVGLWFLLAAMFPHSDTPDIVTIAVHDPGASRLVAALRETPLVRLIEVDSEEGLPAVVQEKAVGGFIVPASFGAAVRAGERPELIVYVNRRRSSGEIALLQRLVEEQVWTLVGQEAPARITWQSVAVSPGIFDAAGLRVGNLYLIMLLVMGLSMAGSFVVPALIVEEKEKRTLEALLVSPAGPAEVTAGKALTGLVYSLLTAGVLVTLAKAWGPNWLVMAVAVLLGSLFIVGVGLLMGGVFRNTQQLNTWSSFVLLLLMAPSWIGIIGSQSSLATAASVVPTHYLRKALELALAGEGFTVQMWANLLVLAANAAITLVCVAWRLRREEG